MEAEPGTAHKLNCSECGRVLEGRTAGETCGTERRRGGMTFFKCQGILMPPFEFIKAEDAPALKEKMREAAGIPKPIDAEGDRDLLQDMRTYLAGVVAGSIIGNDAETQAEELIGRISEMIDGGGRNTDAAQGSPP